MAHVFAKAYGPDWLTKVAGADKFELWAGRAEAEAKSRGRRGALGMPAAGLSYANLYDLITIAKKHWEPLAPALYAKAEVMPLLERLETLRNAVGHSRPLVPYEEDLLTGIAGQIRNQVTIFMSAQDGAGDIYPRIESVTDSIGQRIESSTVDGEIAGSILGYQIVLQPGDVVTFTCVGIDPQGRDLRWSCKNPRSSEVVSRSGEAAILTWTVADEDVTETAASHVYLESDGTKYHRFGWIDHRAYFTYRVRPPAL